MASKTLLKWSKKITPSQVLQLIRAERDVQKAALIFDSATAEYSNGFRHDHNTFALMISRFACANQFRLAEKLLNRMKEEKCKLTEDIFLSICKSYGRARRPLDALRVFRKMKEFECEATEKSYITVFSILVGGNQLKMAQKFYRYMKEVGVPPSVASLNVLIKALCMNEGTIDAAFQVFREMPSRGCIPDSFTYGTLVNGLCKLGKISKAKELFKEMEIKGCSPTVVTYTSLIHGLCRSSNLDEAMGLLEEMISRGIEPNVVTFSSLMDGLCKADRSSLAMELFEKMVGKKHSPNIITYSTLIDGLCREGKLQEAIEILDRMKLQSLKPDVGLYGKLIYGLCNSSQFQMAANFLDEMLLAGITPSRINWSLHVKIHNVVVQGLSSANELDRAFLLYLSMRTRGISTEEDTFRSLVVCFCKKGDVNKAARIVSEMVLDGCVPDAVTWNAIVGGFWSRRKVQEAAELVQVELKREFFGTCNLSATSFCGS